MLHLLPVIKILKIFAAAIAIAVVAAVYAGAIGTGNAFSDVSWVIRWSSVAAMALALGPYMAWRWMSFVQSVIFPYLGGSWSGNLTFNGEKGSGTRDVTLVIRHSFLKVELILDSKESTSRTLVVHAERDAGINRDRLYYVYLNERKEGFPGGGDRYRGLAVLRVEKSGHLMLHGDYFTEERGHGELHLKREQPHSWWAIWK